MRRRRNTTRKSRAIYRNYLRGKKWKKKRKAVMRRAGYTCRCCGGRATEVHHRTYKRIFREKVSDLEAVCRQCHKHKHKQR